MTTDLFDVRYAARATGTLAAFNRAGVLTAADAHVAATLGRLARESDEGVLLAAAFAVRGVRLGSVCVDLLQLRRTATADTEEPVDLDALPWPDPAEWPAACQSSPLVAAGVTGAADRPLRLVDGLLYLDRYWQQEEQVRAELDARATRPPPPVDESRLSGALGRFFPGDAPDHQRLAAAACATGWVTVVAGGPGTGKTTTVARLLAVLGAVLDPPPRVALAAPTGKAAARLQQAVAEETARLVTVGLPAPGPLAASTLHRLLGWRPGSHSRFRHDRSNRLPYDVVVVDETSMVSLTLMARLLEAVRPDARIVLVGDPDQLASVEAGAVLGDLVARPPRPSPDPRADRVAALLPADVETPAEVAAELRNDVVRLRTTYRFEGTISTLAEAIRTGWADDVLAALRSREPDVEFLESASPDARTPIGLESLRLDVEIAGRALVAAALAGDVTGALDALEGHRLLCAHRLGPYGVTRWSAEVERWVAAVAESEVEGEWYLGRPLLVTTNDYELKLYNGDTGVVVDGGARGPLAAFRQGGEIVLLPPGRLSAVQTVHAMTVHRGQGSQFRRVSVLLPPADSPLLTRELLYTAVTRAREFVRVIGTEDAVRAAVERPIVRASGLRRRRD
ncbi:MAG: exodeoxyribonuclease V subunit alpha [Mycobacteriales bacterium]